jgi:hypothetical protein
MMRRHAPGRCAICHTPKNCLESRDRAGIETRRQKFCGEADSSGAIGSRERSAELEALYFPASY